jgi:hypothetical protein
VQLAHDLLAVTEHRGVEERRQRLGVVRAVPAREHDGVVSAAVRGVQRDPGEVEHVEDVRVRELRRQVERDGRELRGGPRGLDGEQREALGAHRRLHVRPRRVRALRGGVVALVQDGVEDLEALVGKPDLVGVGVAEQPPHDVV